MIRFGRTSWTLAVAIIAVAANARTDQNSFLNRPANTLRELINQIKTDNQVSSRFMRHFGMSKDEVIGMVSNFKLGRLPSDGVYVVYNVPSWEEVRARALMMKKGTLVWTDQGGTPMLKASCGNPMARGTDIGLAVATPGVKVVPNTELRDLVVLHTPETSFIDETVSLASPSPVEMHAADVLPTTPQLPAAAPAALSGLIIPITAGLLLGINHGDTNPVPEPCTIIVTGISVAGIIARRRLKNR